MWTDVEVKLLHYPQIWALTTTRRFIRAIVIILWPSSLLTICHTILCSISYTPSLDSIFWPTLCLLVLAVLCFAATVAVTGVRIDKLSTPAFTANRRFHDFKHHALAVFTGIDTHNRRDWYENIRGPATKTRAEAQQIVVDVQRLDS